MSRLAPSGSRARGWPPVSRLPAWAQVLGAYAVARFVTFLITVGVARFQVDNVWTAARPAYLDFVRIWDGEWYHRIVVSGYPLPLPTDAAGNAYQSEWAFFPSYPMLVRGLMEVTGLPFRFVSSTTSLLLGAAAVWLMYKLFRLRADHGTALVGVTLFSFFPTAPVLQYAYTESMAILALTAATYLLVTRRYLWCLLPVVLLGLTRPVGVPFGVVVLAHLVHRWLGRRRERLPVGDAVAIVVLGLVTAVSSVAWPVYVGVATGIPNAYTEVQSAWHGGDLGWVRPWVDMASYLLGDTMGPLVLFLLVVGFVVLLVGPVGRSLGVEMATWCGAYAAYLLVVVQPYTSVFRYLLLLFPLALAVARTVRSRAHLVTWLFALVALQIIWIDWLWRFTPPSDLPP